MGYKESPMAFVKGSNNNLIHVQFADSLNQNPLETIATAEL